MTPNRARLTDLRESVGYAGTQHEYQEEVERTQRAAILHMGRNGSTRVSGICMRLFNNNGRSHRLIENLRLPREPD